MAACAGEKSQVEVSTMIPYGYGGKELGSAFRTVRKNTIQIAEEIPEEKYSFAPAPDTKPVGKVLTHIAMVPQISEEIHKTKRVTSLAGFDFLSLRDRLLAEEAKQRSKAEIVALLRTEGERFAEWLDLLSPEFLAEQVTQPDGRARSRDSRCFWERRNTKCIIAGN